MPKFVRYMNVKFDPVDVVGAGCWDCISRLFLFATSLWVGGGIGAWALNADDLLDSPVQPIVTFLIGPFYLLSALAFITLPTVLIGIFIFIRTEKELAPRWAGFASAIGFFVLLGNFRGVKHHWLSWPIWLILTLMLCTATWFFIEWQRNRWVQELEILKDENRQRRADMHAEFGTSPLNMYEIDDEP